MDDWLGWGGGVVCLLGMRRGRREEGKTGKVMEGEYWVICWYLV